MKMKQLCIAIGVALFALVATTYAQNYYTKEYQSALAHGAKARVTVHVVDDAGNAVPNATTKVFFEMTSGRSLGNKRNGVTDEYGNFTAEARTTSMIYLAAEKEGYYAGWGEYMAQSRDPERLKDECWLPWNPTFKIVIKRIIKPVHMEVNVQSMALPETGTSMGFDLKVHDWVAPCGKGQVADMIVHYGRVNETSFVHRLIVEFPGEKNGAYICKKDNNGILRSDYHAKIDGPYQTRLESKDDGQFSARELLTNEDYCVFRIRSKLDKDGNLVSALYGKIYGPFILSDRMRFRVHLNPVENDTNLEFDGKGFGDGKKFGR